MKKILLILSIFLLSNSWAVSLNDKIGQMIIVGFNGDATDARGFKKIEKKIKKGEVSGIIYFGKNITSASNVIQMNKKLKRISKIKPFIAIDNEGGNIQRYQFSKYLPAKYIPKLDEDKARKHYKIMAYEMKKLGFNTNFAPVVDLEINEHSIISKKLRSFSDDPDTVSKYASIFIEEHNKQGIITSIKHFPGHGSAIGDTHKGFVDATRTFMKTELEPYQNLKNYNKMNMVMVSHIFNSDFDNKYPASLSKKTIDILKNDIGFNGVIISDDLDMGAVRKNYSLDEIVINSINSGVNILLFSENIGEFDPKISNKVRKIIKKQIKKGNIKESDIDKSYNKIIKLKSYMN